MILMRQPLDIHIVNLYMEKSIARAIKSSWHFLFGPQVGRRLADSQLLTKLDEAEELGFVEDAEGSKGEEEGDGRKLEDAVAQMQAERSKEAIVLERHTDFVPHPFCPRITTKGIRQALKLDSGEERIERGQ